VIGLLGIAGDLVGVDFYMATNEFSTSGGFLSSSIGVFTKLQRLGLQGMPHIGGTLPSELSLLTALTFLYLEGCSFTGSLPSITNIPGLANAGSCSIVSGDRESDKCVFDFADAVRTVVGNCLDINDENSHSRCCHDVDKLAVVTDKQLADADVLRVDDAAGAVSIATGDNDDYRGRVDDHGT
jgi:hypothetical protein